MVEYDRPDTVEAYDGSDAVETYDRPETVADPGRRRVAPAAEVRPTTPAQVHPPLGEAQHEHVLHRKAGATDPSEGASRTSRGATGRLASLRRAVVMAEVLRRPVVLRGERREPFA